MESLTTLLSSLDGAGYNVYQKLAHHLVFHEYFQFEFLHIQNSLGACPASIVGIKIDRRFLGLSAEAIANHHRRLATADYLLRELTKTGKAICKSNRGAEGSGSFQWRQPGQQILKRNIVDLQDNSIYLLLHVSLPGSGSRQILAQEAITMFGVELPAVIKQFRHNLATSTALEKQWQCVENAEFIRSSLPKLGLVAFIADGATLPRKSGISDLPMDSGSIPFLAPAELAVEMELPHGGRQRGMGIPEGVTCIIGGGFHGKSTLLAAIARGVYPHIPGDGRELVVSRDSTLMVQSEEGRIIRGTNISAFFTKLPGSVDCRNFFTDNASGSVSQAASIIEGIQAGSHLLLLDEDNSANNFLNRDMHMRRLIPEDPIIPLLDRSRELYESLAVSMVLITGGSSNFFAVADTVIAMRNYQPEVMTKTAKKLKIPPPPKYDVSMEDIQDRYLSKDNFDPIFTAKRHNKSLNKRIKSLRKRFKVLEYGENDIDLSQQVALVDRDQTMAIGQALFTARNQGISGTINNITNTLLIMDLASWHTPDHPLFLAQPRALEIAAAINRLASLRLIPTQ